MNTQLVKILCIIALMAVPSVSLVQAAEGDCVADVQRLCPDVDPAGAQAHACLKENIPELSTGCKENIQKLTNALQSFGEACGQDVQTLCAEVSPGGGRILQCLKENQASVSADCISFLTR